MDSNPRYLPPICSLDVRNWRGKNELSYQYNAPIHQFDYGFHEGKKINEFTLNHRVIGRPCYSRKIGQQEEIPSFEKAGQAMAAKG